MKGLRHIGLNTTHIVHNRFVLFLLRAHEFFDIHVGLIWSLEESNDFLVEFSVRVRFLRLYFRKMGSIEVIYHVHHMIPFWDFSDRKVIFHLVNQSKSRSGSGFGLSLRV